MFATNEYYQVLTSENYAKALIRVIDNAKKTIDIMMFDWKWYKGDFSCDVSLINQAIMRAHRRGVRVRIISNNLDVRGYFATVDVEVRPHNVHGVFHAKLWIFDDFQFVIGSHNMTMGAMSRNFEVSLLQANEDIAKSYTNLFNSIWS